MYSMFANSVSRTPAVVVTRTTTRLSVVSGTCTATPHTDIEQSSVLTTSKPCSPGTRSSSLYGTAGIDASKTVSPWSQPMSVHVAIPAPRPATARSVLEGNGWNVSSTPVQRRTLRSVLSLQASQPRGVIRLCRSVAPGNCSDDETYANGGTPGFSKVPTSATESPVTARCCTEKRGNRDHRQSRVLPVVFLTASIQVPLAVPWLGDSSSRKRAKCK